ncbi:MAG: hypothetical protein K1X36_14150 [Pyrinomonadaceae bacterium]|nr:hypothetical protein [Pyrinomonadaceae bacterium]
MRSLINSRLTVLVLVLSLLLVSSGMAQSTSRTFAVELVVTKDKTSFETDADIIFGEKTVKIVPDKSSLSTEIREFAYTDIKFAEQSYSKKPIFSVGGGITTVVLTSLIVPFIAVPFLFIKKKKHWMTVRTDDSYAVLKLGDRNFRQIAAELETRGVKVSELKEKEK